MNNPGSDNKFIADRTVCLTIGGSDSCAGAGIQADLRIFEQFGIRGCSVLTALTAQNPRKILRIEPVSLAQLDAQLSAIFNYYDVSAIKTGMLASAEHVAVIAAALGKYHTGKPLVIDPVMGASSGCSLLDEGAVPTLKRALIKQATLVTPNSDEANILLGYTVNDPVENAMALTSGLGCAVLLKGGRGNGNSLLDVLCDEHGEITSFTHPKRTLNEMQAHGTGCRLAAGIAASLGLGYDMPDSVGAAIKRLQEALYPDPASDRACRV